MKILVVSHLWPRPQWPHLGSFVAEQAASLTKYGEVTVAIPINTSARKSELSFSEAMKGFRTYKLRRKSPLIEVRNVKIVPIFYKGGVRRRRNPGRVLRSLVEGLQQFNADEFDIVHAHTLFPDGLACAHWLENHSPKLIVTSHGSDVHSIYPKVKELLDPLLNRADMFIPVSQYLGDFLREWGVPEKRMTVIFNGFKTEEFKRLDVELKKPNLVMYLGRIDKVKRVDLLIQAINVCNPKVHLMIAGDGTERKACEELVEKLGLQERVQFLGMIKRNEVPCFLVTGSLLCLFSTREGWPTIIFEALASGTPILATDAGGTSEAISDPRLGKVVPIESTPEQLSQEIEAALAKEWDYQYIRNYAYTFSWDYIAEQLVKVYKSILQSN